MKNNNIEYTPQTNICDEKTQPSLNLTSKSCNLITNFSTAIKNFDEKIHDQSIVSIPSNLTYSGFKEINLNNNFEISNDQNKKRFWTNDEDELLKKLVEKHGARNWWKISSFFINRTDVQCLHRWQKVLNPS